MPIKSTAFGDPTPAPAVAPDPALEPAPAGPVVGAEEPKKRTRRTKVEMISDAVIPGNDDPTEVKFVETGVDGERPWLVAVELYRDNKVEFKDKTLKYAVMKMDLPTGDKPSAAAPSQDPVDVEALAVRWNNLQEELDETKQSDTEKITALSEESELVRKQIIDAGGSDPTGAPEDHESETQTDTGVQSGNKGIVPEGAELGDEIVSNGETYYVGHGGKPVQHPPSKDDKPVSGSSRWTWDGDKVTRSDLVKAHTIDHQKDAGFHDPASVTNATSTSVEITTERVGQEIEQIAENPRVWKVGTGILEKIGLPNYSSIQVGPNTMSAMAVDDGRRTTTKLPGSNGDAREVRIPTAVVEAFQELEDTVEYVTRIQRGHILTFLESTGASQQS